MDETKTLDKLIEQLTILDQHQVCFARNLFPRPGANRKQGTFKISHQESKFLFLVFDFLHNVPELTHNLIHVKNTGDGINEFLAHLVQGRLSELFSLIKNEEIRTAYGIKDTNVILSWTRCELTWICKDAERILALLPPVLDMMDSKASD